MTVCDYNQSMIITIRVDFYTFMLQKYLEPFILNTDIIGSGGDFDINQADLYDFVGGEINDSKTVQEFKIKNIENMVSTFILRFDLKSVDVYGGFDFEINRWFMSAQEDYSHLLDKIPKKYRHKKDEQRRV